MTVKTLRSLISLDSMPHYLNRRASPAISIISEFSNPMRNLFMSFKASLVQLLRCFPNERKPVRANSRSWSLSKSTSSWKYTKATSVSFLYQDTNHLHIMVVRCWDPGWRLPEANLGQKILKKKTAIFSEYISISMNTSMCHILFCLRYMEHTYMHIQNAW